MHTAETGIVLPIVTYQHSCGVDREDTLLTFLGFTFGLNSNVFFLTIWEMPQKFQKPWKLKFSSTSLMVWSLALHAWPIQFWAEFFFFESIRTVEHSPKGSACRHTAKVLLQVVSMCKEELALWCWWFKRIFANHCSLLKGWFSDKLSRDRLDWELIRKSPKLQAKV